MFLVSCGKYLAHPFLVFVTLNECLRLYFFFFLILKFVLEHTRCVHVRWGVGVGGGGRISGRLYVEQRAGCGLGLRTLRS